MGRISLEAFVEINNFIQQNIAYREKISKVAKILVNFKVDSNLETLELRSDILSIAIDEKRADIVKIVLQGENDGLVSSLAMNFAGLMSRGRWDFWTAPSLGCQWFEFNLTLLECGYATIVDQLSAYPAYKDCFKAMVPFNMNLVTPQEPEPRHKLTDIIDKAGDGNFKNSTPAAKAQWECKWQCFVKLVFDYLPLKKSSPHYNNGQSITFPYDTIHALVHAAEVTNNHFLADLLIANTKQLPEKLSRVGQNLFKALDIAILNEKVSDLGAIRGKLAGEREFVGRQIQTHRGYSYSYC